MKIRDLWASGVLVTALMISAALIIEFGRESVRAIASTSVLTRLETEILRAMQEPYQPLPGTKFPQGTWFRPVVGRKASGPEERTAYQVSGFSYDLSSVDLESLFSVFQDVTHSSRPRPSQDLRTFPEIAAEGLLQGTTLLDPIALSVGLFYADRFSGLGLGLSESQFWNSPEAAGYVIELSDLWRCNSVTLTAWVFASGTMSLTCAYHEYAPSVLPEKRFGGFPVWGTRKPTLTAEDYNLR